MIVFVAWRLGGRVKKIDQLTQLVENKNGLMWESVAQACIRLSEIILADSATLT